MSSANTAVFGLYTSAEAAERAVDRLLKDGFQHPDISILVPENESTRVVEQAGGAIAPEVATAGVSTGSLVGGGLGLLAGLGELAVPDIGPLMAAGPLASTLLGVAVGGTLGGLVGALIGIGIPEYEARLYEGAVKGGEILISIHCEGESCVSAALTVLEESGAQQIASSCEEVSDESLGASMDMAAPKSHARTPVRGAVL